MGIPLGHKIKMMKKIKDMRGEKGLGEKDKGEIQY